MKNFFGGFLAGAVVTAAGFVGMGVYRVLTDEKTRQSVAHKKHPKDSVENVSESVGAVLTNTRTGEKRHV